MGSQFPASHQETRHHPTQASFILKTVIVIELADKQQTTESE